jgi:hypothetical protein
MNNPIIKQNGAGAVNLTANIASPTLLVLRSRIVFKWLTWIFAICILTQVFLAGLAIFWNSDKWASHTGFSRILMIIPVLMFVTSFIARLPVSLRLHSAGLIGLIILIAVSANLSSGLGYLSALHPVIALMLFWGTISLARKTDALIKAK